MILYHGGSEEIKYPEIKNIGYTKDFSWGFYCTNNYEQAKRWAKRKGRAIVNKYEYNENKQLKIKIFNEPNNEWLEFVVASRNGKKHDFDIVEGPMADDTIWNFINSYILKEINKEQFFVLMKFKHPTHQISFHTKEALECLKFIESEEIK